MKRILEILRSEKAKDVLVAVKIFAMLVLLYLYLMYADLSTAPEFIYNQF